MGDFVDIRAVNGLVDDIYTLLRACLREGRELTVLVDIGKGSGELHFGLD